MDDLISIIVPVYNVEKYLRKCIDSIINQTYKNLEIILVDDGSPDNCGTICDEYAQKDNRIKVIHKENGGVSSARNEGLRSATGKWISFIDADDWIEEIFCEILLNKAVKNRCDVALCGYSRVTDNRIEKINANGKDAFFNSKEYLIKSLNPQTGFGFCHMKLIKKEILNNISFNENIVVGEDALFCIMFSINIKKSIFVEKALYNYRVNRESVVRKYDVDYVTKYKKSMELMHNYIMQEYSENKEIEQNLYNYIAYHILLIAVNYCFNPSNQQKTKSIRKLYDIEIFKNAIKYSNYNMMSITRKITLFFLKNKCVLLVGVISWFRQSQLK